MTDIAIDTDALQPLLPAALQASGVPGVAVAVVRADEAFFLSGGVKALGGEDPVTSDTLFGIGSVTKGVTTVALALLVDEGKMRWDDPVRAYVPSFRLQDPLADAQVTLRDLVCHRTGLSRHELLWYGAPWGRAEVIRRIGLVAPSTPFRSRYEYQNIMYLIAGEAVAQAAGCSWEEFVKTRLFDPLGMTGANFDIDAAQAAPNVATPHEKKTGVYQPVPWVSYDNIAPGGAINASARDMSRWVHFHLAEGAFQGQRLVSDANLRETHTPQMVVRLDDGTRSLYPETMQMSYGLGWSVWDYRGRLVVSHGGETDGFTAQVALLPRERLGVVILSNASPTWLPQALRNSLFDALLGPPAPVKDWNALFRTQAEQGEAKQRADEETRLQKRHPGTTSSRELAAYAGAYEDPAYGTARVALENGALSVQWSSWTSRLEHVHYDTFTTAADGSPLEKRPAAFVLDADGNVAALRFLDRDFRKSPPPAEPGGS